MDPTSRSGGHRVADRQAPGAGRDAPSGTSSRRVDGARPFFAHLRLDWWRVLLIVPVLMAALFAMQFLPGAIVALMLVAVEGEQVLDDPAQLAGRPVMLLSANLALGLLIPTVLLLVRWIGGVPWRAVLASGRAFSWRRLFVLAPIVAVVFTIAVLLTVVLVPHAYGTFSVTGAMVVLLLITVFTMPLASAAEEVVFRGGIGPAVGSWFRGEKAAVVAGLLVSTVLFAFVHFSGDPWLVAYQVWFGLVVGLLALMTRGIEASVAFHAIHNVVLFVCATVLSGGAGIAVDRSGDDGNTTTVVMLVFVPFHVLLLAIVYLMERRRRPVGS